MVSRETPPPILLPPCRLPRPPHLRRLLLFLRCCPSPIVEAQLKRHPFRKSPVFPNDPAYGLYCGGPAPRPTLASDRRDIKGQRGCALPSHQW